MTDDAPTPAGFAASHGSANYRGYTIARSNGRGGKAGRGRNITATLQVREPLMGGDYLLRKQFSYRVAVAGGEAEALRKATAFIEGISPNVRISDGEPKPSEL